MLAATQHKSWVRCTQMGERQELGYIITAVFLASITELSKSACLLSWEKACDPSVVALKASPLWHTARLDRVNNSEKTNRGLLRPQKPGRAHCGSTVLNSGNNPSSQARCGCPPAPRREKGLLVLSGKELDNGPFLWISTGNQVAQTSRKDTHTPAHTQNPKLNHMWILSFSSVCLVEEI